jgi:hypothetical protein
MADNLRAIVKDIRFNLVTERQIEDDVAKIYALGYKAGRNDQRKITQRVKYRYGVLVNWLMQQIGSLSMYTKRYEYKQLMEGMLDITDSFMFENNLNSSYKPKVFSYTIGEEEFVVDAKKDIAYLLVDVVGNFTKQEELKNK